MAKVLVAALLLPSLVTGFAPRASSGPAARAVAPRAPRMSAEPEAEADADAIPDELPDNDRSDAPLDLDAVGLGMPAGAASSAGSALLDLDLWEREPTDLLAGFDLDAITAEIEVDDADDETPRIRMERERASTMETHRRFDADHGSPEVQICSFTARIKFITQHCIEHPKDHSSRRGLLKLVSQRRRMMLYYHKKNPAGAVALAKELGIRFRFQDQIQTRAEKYREFTLRQRK